MGSLFELRWQVDTEGYAIDWKDEAPATSDATVMDVLRDIFEGDGANARVVARGGRLESYRCKADDPRILLDLLRMAETPDGVLGFVNRWGLLAAPAREAPQRVGEIIANKTLLTEVRDGGLPRSRSEIRLASLELVRGSDGQPALRANTLEDFLWAQVYELRHGPILRCSVCRKLFLAKVTRRHGRSPYMTGRPRDTCSDACRQKARRQRLARARA